ncbi:MOSC N-terminal beta barrel domain-containing protein [Streptomyces sp. N2-109]|uniref:MOSC N-terminal beta barrel domain-containing protein n=1 Tax=Streptomyces gossypii TaxID=2883101 RepID=A0ABT2JNR8_9ACTN|nr:MOSC N-terminal beta barrel domain-containing protein [Streptomyces gossypii]MCT2589530.1 MOSC N-terminal beta barrel domain-containing protein [Streptomyces gossypii]
MATITELITYPVKGCAGISVRDSPVTPAGLAHDRSFLVVAEDGVFRSQRRSPLLAVVRPEIDPAGESLTLRAPDTEPLRIEVDREGPRRDVEMFRVPYRAIDQGEAVAEWLSTVLGEPSRLVRVPPEHGRVTAGQTPGTSGFADSSAMHLLSLPTMGLLNERLAARGSAPLPSARFRPNIVVDGWGADGLEPHAEDRARRIEAGSAEFGYAKLAIRCAVTTVEQRSGLRAGPEPLRTLAEYRRAAEGGVAFGAKFSVLRPGKVSVGDEAAVTAWGPSEF